METYLEKVLRVETAPGILEGGHEVLPLAKSMEGRRVHDLCFHGLNFGH